MVEAGFTVTGYDRSRTRIEQLAAGSANGAGIQEERFLSIRETGRLSFTSDPELLADAEVLVVCVPVPLRDELPDLVPLIDGCRQIGKFLGRGRLVVVESAPFPGATEEVVLPLLEGNGCVGGRDFLLACSPPRPAAEADDPRGGPPSPKVVGGVTPEATGVAGLFYGQLWDDVIAVSSSRAAELAKLLDGAFHNVNTALVNELAVVCHEAGIDVWEVLQAASTRSLGFEPFQRGAPVAGYRPPPGIGAPNVEVELNGRRPLRILDQALEINAEMPNYVASRIADALNDARKAVKGAQILVLGVSGEGGDLEVRDAPALRVIANLVRRGARMSFHDPSVSSLPFDGAHLMRIDLTERAVQAADCVALLAPQGAYDLGWVEEHAQLLFDARNAFGSDRRRRVIRL